MLQKNIIFCLFNFMIFLFILVFTACGINDSEGEIINNLHNSNTNNETENSLNQTANNTIPDNNNNQTDNDNNHSVNNENQVSNSNDQNQGNINNNYLNNISSNNINNSNVGNSNSLNSNSSPENQLKIIFGYRYDTIGFFNEQIRRNILEQAADIWGSLIKDKFSVIPAGTELRFKNPANRDEYVFVTFENEIKHIVIFVGASTSLQVLGRGGSAGYIDSTIDSSIADRMEQRYYGDDFEPWAGSITWSTNVVEWYFDETPNTDDDIPYNSFDFLTSALHEIGHVLGFNPDRAAFSNHLDQNGDFTGPVSVSVYGSTVPLAANSWHIEDGITFNGLEPMMDPGQTNGVRVLPTALDLAIFDDIGYEF